MSDEMKLIEALANALGFNVIKKKTGDRLVYHPYIHHEPVYGYSLKPRNNDCKLCGGDGYYFEAKCRIDCEECNKEEIDATLDIDTRSMKDDIKTFHSGKNTVDKSVFSDEDCNNE